MPAPGMPESSPAAFSVTPAGSGPAVLKVGAGAPFAVTLKLPLVPTVNVVALALVMLGA